MEPLTMEEVLVTPELAAEWLKHNTRNRLKRPKRIAAYSRDMAAGRWRRSGEAIKFAPDGTLLDGQNRLKAIIDAGVSVVLMVVRGIEPEAQMVMDSGIGRTASDATAMRSIKHASTASAATRWCLTWANGGIKHAVSTPNAVTHSEIVEFIECDQYIGEAVALGVRYGRYGKSNRQHMPTGSSVACFAWLAAQVADWPTVTEFLRRASELDLLGDGDPVRAAVQRFTTARVNKETIRTSTEVYILLRAWNAEQMGDELRRIPTEKAGAPLAFPPVAPAPTEPGK